MVSVLAQKGAGMAHVLDKSGLEKWQDGLRTATADPRWHLYDCEIKMAIGEFDRQLGGTVGYRSLNWQLIKAILWTETGASNSEWYTKPMQIGVVGDPGLTSLLAGKEGGELILPTALKARLSPTSVRSIPSHNIRAGIAYLLMRMAKFEWQSVVAGGINPVREIKVKTGDSLERIAIAQGTTAQIIKSLNPNLTTLRPGQLLKFRKGKVERVIAGWQSISTAAIARRYNGGGDFNYARKLDFALGLIRQRKEVTCALNGS
jgi:LysM repeat protein